MVIINYGDIIRKLLTLGATEVEVYSTKTVTTSVSFTDKIEVIKTTENLGVGIRTVLGRKVGIFGTNDVTPKGIEKAIMNSYSIAKVSPEDPYWKSLAKGLNKTPVKNTYDTKIVKADPSLVVDKVNETLNPIKDLGAKVKPVRGLINLIVEEVSIANSYNEKVSRKGTSAVIYIEVKAEEAGKTATFSKFEATRMLSDMNFEKLGYDAASKAIEFLNATKIPTAKMDVIFDAEVFASILNVMISGPISADWVQKGKSPLAGKLGKEIANNQVTIIDDGTYEGMIGTKEFDDEGVPTTKTIIINEGVLNSFIYDTYTANKENRKSTGNAHRTVSSAPIPLPNNLIMKPGTYALDEMIKETKRGLYIIKTIGEWLSNPVSGNLNATVTHAYLVEGGEIKGTVKGVVVSADFYEIIKNNIDAISKEVKKYHNLMVPHIKFKSIQLAG